MYSKKYKLVEFDEILRTNTFHDTILGCTCYLAYLKPGERGWFLYKPEWLDQFAPVRRVHTSPVQDVVYLDNGDVILTTKNTRYVFALDCEGEG